MTILVCQLFIKLEYLTSYKYSFLLHAGWITKSLLNVNKHSCLYLSVDQLIDQMILG